MKRYFKAVLTIASGIILGLMIPCCFNVPRAIFAKQNQPFHPMEGITVVNQVLYPEDIQWIVNVAATELAKDEYIDFFVDEVIKRLEKK